MSLALKDCTPKDQALYNDVLYDLDHVDLSPEGYCHYFRNKWTLTDLHEGYILLDPSQIPREREREREREEGGDGGREREEASRLHR